MNKTIFIVITRSFLIRNIMRSGVVDYLKKRGCKIVVFLQVAKGHDIPDYLREEFGGEAVRLEKLEPVSSRGFFVRLYRFFVRWTSLLVYSDSTWAYSKAGNVNSRSRIWIWKYVEKAIFSVLTKIHFLKSIVRSLEKSLFMPDSYSEYFTKYQPDLVFSTSIVSGIDIDFLKAAFKRGIKTVGMTKGWDHASRVLYRFVPDRIIIQNEVMRDYLIRYQRINSDIIKVCGFPQFDWYADKSLLVSREEFFATLGIDPAKKLILFGSEGAWSPGDDNITGLIAAAIDSHRLARPAAMLIRPHFSDLKTTRFDRFRKAGLVAIDGNVSYQDSLAGNWEPGRAEIKHFVNLLHHLDVLVNVASTLTLDACCFNKPIVAIGFGVLFNLRTGRDVTNTYYEMDHYQDVLKTGAVDLVKSENELVESLNKYLLNPEHKNEQRKILLDKLCYKVDGHSAERVATEILSML